MGYLKIVEGNVLDYINDCDAIINSTNEYMIAGSGVCGSIYKRAGKDDLEQYCKKKYGNKMMTNEVRITPGFKLNVDIINIFAPKYYQQSEPLLTLVESYKKIFESAKKNNYKNILTVSIGTGVHGYKHNEISKIVIDTINELTKKYDINCIMVLQNNEIVDIYKKYFNV
jgi:O-acetyl-ADP-ribose deacetylase (regulator of RNase III)